ncbi:MAG: phage baseplate assembly protein V [Proteobacteria bacterium]|nr:phage baseplate assembly protein V [Pseudomonadota bacterium]
MTDPNTERLLVEVAEYMRHRYFGKYRGIVQEVGERDNLGRIKDQVPEIYGDAQGAVSPWALPCVPFAGRNHGLVVLPEMGDGVWIEFEAGDIARPIWSGCWWADGELPTPGAPQVRALITTAGHKLILDDEQNQVKLVHAGGAELAMTNNDITIKIGSTQMVMSTSGVNINNGAFEVR